MNGDLIKVFVNRNKLRHGDKGNFEKPLMKWIMQCQSLALIVSGGESMNKVELLNQDGQHLCPLPDLKVVNLQ